LMILLAINSMAASARLLNYWNSQTEAGAMSRSRCLPSASAYASFRVALENSDSRTRRPRKCWSPSVCSAFSRTL
jgi:hypothetical protein